MNSKPVIAIRGGGDLATACALRLYRCGMNIVIAEREHPTAVRRSVALSEAIFEATTQVEGVRGDLVHDPSEILMAWDGGSIPVAVAPEMREFLDLHLDVTVDARMAKANVESTHRLAPGMVGLGPGFHAGSDVDAVVETNRGPDLGRVIWSGRAAENSHVPALVEGHGADRVLRAPASGLLVTVSAIGEVVKEGSIIAEIEGSLIRAPFQGVVRGLLRSGSPVALGMKVGDVDPRLDPGLCHRVSDKALAVAGGVLEATFVLLTRAGWNVAHQIPGGASHG